jgi:hypothetical protein
MDEATLKALRDAARAATPGPWTAHDNPGDWGMGGAVFIDGPDGKTIATVDYKTPYCTGESRRVIDAAMQAKASGLYIAAASPDTILAVLRELEVLQQTLQVALDADCPIKQLRQSRLAAWRAQAERELEEKHGE